MKEAKTSNIIQLLARMGQDASLQTPAEFEQVIRESELSNELKQSLINKYAISLEKQLDVCPDVVCIMVAHDEEDEDSTGIESSPLSIVA
ncbi:hypothetical protein [Shewanella sp. YLB-07]|uniref:hypothetical protein n=1 Tax=Shewanella sp. YLB-07 TaxID=2601268 RepID=UPI00128B454E|nr:hypothetical protein [Shewanella sp. YLB-07]MPY23393.1 hypothetical protein [Shewanella sp. YLB-07]